MKNVKMLCAVWLFTLALVTLKVQGMEPDVSPENANLLNVRNGELQQLMTPSESTLATPIFAQVTDSTKQAEAPFELIKSPRKALLFSVILPGAGELYSKAYIMSGVFFAAEATLWIMYSSYQGKGKDLEDEFKLYADAHWSQERYEIWINSPEAREINRTHELPDSKTQQYYEMIGKYDQFFKGWDDADNYTYDGAPSPNRTNYMDMREDSNIQLKNATTMISLAILNHIVSAVDAAWASYRYNKNYAKTKGASLQFEPILQANRLYPALSLKMRW
ncbi:DUF5683 domain-containing protein [candidate division KSB1 bacterium]|nr:DUF5683 domain-containing protein [candidate division KSB1 bacterium]